MSKSGTPNGKDAELVVVAKAFAKAFIDSK